MKIIAKLIARKRVDGLNDMPAGVVTRERHGPSSAIAKLKVMSAAR